MSEPKTDQTLNDPKKPIDPNASPAATKMVAPQKMVRIRAKQHLNFITPSNPDGKTANAGDILEVEESVANELCRPIEGNYKFAGELVSEQAERHKHFRAERVTS